MNDDLYRFKLRNYQGITLLGDISPRLTQSVECALAGVNTSLHEPPASLRVAEVPGPRVIADWLPVTEANGYRVVRTGPKAARQTSDTPSQEAFLEDANVRPGMAYA